MLMEPCRGGEACEDARGTSAAVRTLLSTAGCPAFPYALLYSLEKEINLLLSVRVPAVSRHGAQRDVVERRAKAEEEIRLKPCGSGQVVRLAS